MEELKKSDGRMVLSFSANCWVKLVGFWFSAWRGRPGVRSECYEPQAEEVEDDGGNKLRKDVVERVEEVDVEEAPKRSSCRISETSSAFRA
jgi:hypothetical protein